MRRYIEGTAWKKGSYGGKRKVLVRTSHGRGKGKSTAKTGAETNGHQEMEQETGGKEW